MNNCDKVDSRRKATRQGGFTLVEILFVILIMGILVLTAVPSYQEFKARAYDAAAFSDHMNVVKLGIYGGSRDVDESLVVIMFNRQGPGPLTGQLTSISLSDGVVARFIIKIPFIGLGDLILVSTYHENGTVEYRWWDIYGARLEQRIPRG